MGNESYKRDSEPIGRYTRCNEEGTRICDGDDDIDLLRCHTDLVKPQQVSSLSEGRRRMELEVEKELEGTTLEEDRETILAATGAEATNAPELPGLPSDVGPSGPPDGEESVGSLGSPRQQRHAKEGISRSPIHRGPGSDPSLKRQSAGGHRKGAEGRETQGGVARKSENKELHEGREGDVMVSNPSPSMARQRRRTMEADAPVHATERIEQTERCASVALLRLTIGARVLYRHPWHIIRLHRQSLVLLRIPRRTRRRQRLRNAGYLYGDMRYKLPSRFNAHRWARCPPKDLGLMFTFAVWPSNCPPPLHLASSVGLSTVARLELIPHVDAEAAAGRTDLRDRFSSRPTLSRALAIRTGYDTRKSASNGG